LSPGTNTKGVWLAWNTASRSSYSASSQRSPPLLMSPSWTTTQRLGVHLGDHLGRCWRSKRL
jgi:hypothetical protein